MASASDTQRTLYLVFYALSSPKWLCRVHRYLLGYRVGGQKSFFECWFTPAELREARRERGGFRLTDWVIGYDITNPRRLARVYRRMCAHATPLEYSVFLLVGSERAKQRCIEDIAAVIEDKEDDVRCYPLPARGFQARIGRASLPAGINWTGLPAGMA